MRQCIQHIKVTVEVIQVVIRRVIIFGWYINDFFVCIKNSGFSWFSDEQQILQSLDELGLVFLSINLWPHFSHFTQMAGLTTFVSCDFLQVQPFLKCMVDKCTKTPLWLINSLSQRIQLKVSRCLPDLECSLTSFLTYWLYCWHIFWCRLMVNSLNSWLQISHWTLISSLPETAYKLLASLAFQDDAIGTTKQAENAL